jgi:hypothetical protein
MRGPAHCLLIIGSVYLLTLPAHGDDPSFLSKVSHVGTVAPTSTVLDNFDVNPYGIAVAPVTTGALVANSVLVSNFNNSANLQGTGTTNVQIAPSGRLSLFVNIVASSLTSLPGGACPGGVGLTTALVALRSGFVIVGSLPTTDGTATKAQAGCLIILDSNGNPVATLSGNGINGPWDMTALDLGTAKVLFVTNVLNGTVAANGAVVNHGSVLRIVLSIPSGGMPAEVPLSSRVIADAFEERTDPGALVIGPTGLGLGADGTTLFVADTLQNRIAAISNALLRTDDAGAGVTVAQGRALKQPLGLAIAPNGDILTVNSGDGLMLETTPGGQQVGARFVDVSHSRNGAGTLFGLAIASNAGGVYFVGDGNNTLNIMR